MSLKKYLAEAEETINSKIDSPVIGDNFAIELKKGCLFESHVVVVEDDIIVIEADEAAVKFFAEQGMPLGEEAVEETIEYCESCDHVKEQCVCEEETVEESKMSDLDIERQDWETLSPRDFYNRYKMTKDVWHEKYKALLTKEELDYHRVMELAGTPKPLPKPKQVQGIELPVSNVDDLSESKDIVINGKPVDLKSLEVDGVDSSDYPDFADAYISYAEFTDGTPLSDVELDTLQDQHDELAQELAGEHMSASGDAAHDAYKDLDEAEYQGRDVPLGKPMRGDVKKFKVYVRKPDGNVVKVNFGHGGTTAKRLGQKTMRIKKSNPARRKSFRARHNCANPGPRWKARYWSCRAW